MAMPKVEGGDTRKEGMGVKSITTTATRRKKKTRKKKKKKKKKEPDGCLVDWCEQQNNKVFFPFFFHFSFFSF
jgi:hypothetical protein